MRTRLHGAASLAVLSGLLMTASLATSSVAVEAVAPASAPSLNASSAVPPSYATGVESPAPEAKPIEENRPPLTSNTRLYRTKANEDTKVPARPSMRAKGAAKKAAAAASCSTADFASRTGSALVAQIKASTTDCINTLFNVKGADARAIFREAQMTSVAYALRDNATYYTGDNSASTAQLVLFLRAGYYVQFYDPVNVGTYGASLKTAIQSALDAFFASPRSQDVNNANGEILAEAVTLIDSSEQNARYIYVVKRLLNGYNSNYDAHFWMLTAVNNTYTVLFRGHQVPAFVQAVAADRSVLDTLHRFAIDHIGLLSGDQSYLTSNAGRELGRFLGDPSIKETVKPLIRDLLTRSNITGPTAGLWVGVAEMTDSYDRANCSYYDTCNLSERLTAAVLVVDYTCSPSIRIRAQQMSSSDLSASCTSLKGQDAYFHQVARDPGPVANDNNTKIEVVVFDSSKDYGTYAGAIYGIDTNNGGMYLEGDPAVAGNQPRFIAYEAEWVRPTFQVWNLNHEYTHYLDGRFNMYGDFTSNMTTPTVWWIEGFAEYISYSYRKEAYTAAQAEAAKATYTLRTLFDTTYENSDTTRIYRWGYLASAFMINRHPNELQTVLGYYRTGNWNAARAYLTQSIGSAYDSEFRSWLSQCAAGNCGGDGGGTTNKTPSAAFAFTTSGLTATFSDGSSDADGTITARRWDFGDGTSSTSTNPNKTYTAAGTYSVTLTVTDNGGATNQVTKNVSVAAGGGTQVPECTDADPRSLAVGCQRSNRSAGAGDDDYLFFYVPSGTARVTIRSEGGTGNSDLYYSSAGWATPSSHQLRSTVAGNAAQIVVDRPQAGYHYVTLHGATAFSGVNISIN